MTAPTEQRTAAAVGNTGGARFARPLAFTALVIAMFFAMASNTMVLTGLPEIIAELDGTQTQYTWIVTASLFSLAVTTPIWGRLAGTRNRKRLIQFAIVAYVIGSVGAGLATTPWTIVACRAVLGLGAGGIVTLVQLLITDITTPAERPRFFGYFGAVMAVASVAAPALGGFVVDLGGWRWTFFATVPLAVIAIVMIQLFVRSVAPPIARYPTRFDAAGAVLVVVTGLSIMLWLTVVGPGFGWLSAVALAVPAGALLLAVVLAVVERRAAAPLLPPHLFRHPELAKILIASVVVGVATFGASVYLTMYFQSARGISAGAAGLLLVPLSAATFLASLGAGRYIGRTGRDKAALVTGAAAVVGGLLLLVTLDLNSSLVLVATAAAVIGAGLGILTQQLVATGQRYLAAQDIAVGSSLILFVRSLATVLCLSAFGAVVSAALAAEPGAVGYASGVRTVFQVCAALGVIGLIALIALRRPGGEERA